MRSTDPTRFAPALVALASLALALGCAAEADDTGGAADAAAGPADAAAPHVEATGEVEAGRYLASVAGCNDCHTAGFHQSGGQVPEEDRFTGSRVGFRGPWGTTYPANLRLSVEELTEAEWVELFRSRTSRPPMPWWSLHEMSEPDVRALYAYFRSLGPKGSPVPAYVPPGEEPETPFYRFVPVEPGG